MSSRASGGTAGPADGPRVRRVRLSDARKRAPSRLSEKTVVTVEVLVFSRGPRRRDGTRVVARLEPPLGAAQPDRRLAAAMNTARSGKKTMASWVADLEQGTAARRPDDAGRFGATARASPPRRKRTRPEGRLRSTRTPRRSPPPPPRRQQEPGEAAAGRRRRRRGRNRRDASRGRSVRPDRPFAIDRAEEEGDASVRSLRLDRREDPVELAEHQSTRASDARLTDARAATSLWDRVSTAVESCSVALDDAAAATEWDAVPDPAAGTPGFGRTSNAVYGAGAKESGARSNVSNATRKKRVTRAAAKDTNGARRVARVAFGFRRAEGFRDGYASGVVPRAATENGVARQLQSTAGYAEETTARLKQTSQAHKQAQMTAKQLGEALDAANAHIADLSARVRSAEAEASEVRAARVRAREGGYRRAGSRGQSGGGERASQGGGREAHRGQHGVPDAAQGERDGAPGRARRGGFDARGARGEPRRLVRQGAPRRRARGAERHAPRGERGRGAGGGDRSRRRARAEVGRGKRAAAGGRGAEASRWRRRRRAPPPRWTKPPRRGASTTWRCATRAGASSTR